MKRLLVAALLIAFMSGCALVSPAPPLKEALQPNSIDSIQVSRFSEQQAGNSPPGWEPLVILRNRPATAYRLVNDGDTVVLHAFARNASSALMHALAIEPARQPWLHWRWKVRETPMKGASPAERGSPVRIVLGFDGDRENLPFAEQVLFETAKLITGHDFPYATLMYVWSEDLPEGAVVHSRHSSRIRMIVAESGQQGLGSWRSFSRNIAEDFERAFGEVPGRLLGIGVLTDDDGSGPPTEAWYGDVRLEPVSGSETFASRIHTD